MNLFLSYNFVTSEKFGAICKWDKVTRVTFKITNLYCLYICAGLHFYDEVGNLTTGFKNGETITKTRAAAEKGNVGAVTLNPAETQRIFPFIHMDNAEEAIWEKKNAGIVNPRKMVG